MSETLSAKPNTNVYFDGLNPLRFIAAYMILLVHTKSPFTGTAIDQVWWNMGIGVDFFFIISGFLITYLLMKEKSVSGKIHFYNFYVRRALRIFPLYYLVILGSYLYFKGSIYHVDYRPHLYFWGNFQMIKEGQWIMNWLTPLWSICVEEHFYWVVPFIVGIVPIKHVKKLFIGIIILSVGIKAYFHTVHEQWFFYIYLHTLSKMDLLAIGGLLACLHFENPFRITFKWYYLFVPLFLIFIILSCIDMNDYSNILFAMFKRYLTAIPFVVFLIIYLFSESKKLDVFRKNKVLNYLGKISYGIYMFHAIAEDFMGKVYGENLAMYILSSTVITITAAAISYELFEKQILKLKARFEVIKTSPK